MAVITREAIVDATPDALWENLVNDPNKWAEWLTPIRGYEEKVAGATRPGLEFHIRLGKLGGKVQVTEAIKGRSLAWKAGPGMMLAMGMAMRGRLTFQQGAGTTKVVLRMVTPMMMGPMMKMMSGLDPKTEMNKSIQRIGQFGHN